MSAEPAALGLQAAGSLFWISVGALFVPLICRRFRMPSAVGELLYGMAMGPHALRLLSAGEFVSLMAQLGFAILMFGAGLEIDFRPLRRNDRTLMISIGLWTAASLTMVIAGVVVLRLDPWLALAVSCVSIGLASVILRERELLTAPVGQVVLALGLVGETISIAALTGFNFFFSLGGFGLHFLLALVRFAAIFFIAYLVMRGFRLLIWLYPKNVGKFLRDDPLELGVRLAMAMLFIFWAMAVWLGVESILGAFIAGALFSFIFPEREKVSEKINALGQGFFIPFFFIVVGSQFHPPASGGAIPWELLGRLLLLAVAVKLVPFLLFARHGLGLRQVLAGGLLLATPLTLTIAVAEVGLRVYVQTDGRAGVSPQLQSALILLAVFAGTALPFLARMLLGRHQN